MQWIQIIILAIVQGIAEFLPVSSSGHLAVLGTLFDLNEDGNANMLTINILLHVGTLGAIIVVYWRRILTLLTDDRRVVPLIVVGSIPTVIIGVGVKLTVDEILNNALLAGFMFILTGIMLLWIGKRDGELRCRDLTYRQAMLVGLFQGFAVLPGLSRSGWTIAAGLGNGLRRDEAATFSFLLAIPAIGGAGLIELAGLVRDFMQSPETVQQLNVGQLAVGTVVSFLVGIVALTWLLRWLERGHLTWFAYWVLLLGPIVIIWQLVQMFG